MGIAHPKKLIRELIRSYGGRHYAKENDSPLRGDIYIFPDGYRLHVPGTPIGSWVAAQRESLARRYGPVVRSDRYERLGSRPGKPVIDFERLTASTHAKERLVLMQRQARVDFREVLHCLRLPQRVAWSEVHGSWLWIRDRLAVAVAESAGGFVITTVLWASNELWEAHPRPVEQGGSR